MALDLSELKFVVNDSDLKRASETIGELVTNVGKLDKAARTAAQTEAILARAAKDNAAANLQNAKAQDVRLKTTVAADKADKANEKSTLAKTKALESHTKASKENASILQRQTDIYDFLAQGFSKGQASILASAKATGQYSKDLEQVLELQKQFTSDPFDRSDTGLKRLQRTIKEVTDAQNYFNDGHNLTSKQARELSNDLDRLNAGMKQQGKSYQEITKAQAVYKQQFLEEAKVVNQANSALAVVEKQRKEVVTATNYVTQADQKMAAALNTSNAALDKAGTDSLVRYETALRKSGVSQDVATAKLATYKAQLTQVAGIEEKRRAQHLARALQPQFTDIAVSLYSGQAPLTVLLQQSSQMLDLFKLSGIEAANLGKVMKEAFASMIPAIATVAKGLGSLVVESFLAAGTSVTNFVGKITGINAAMEIAKRAIVSGGEANFKYIASLDKMGKTFSMVAATGVAALIAGMILLGLEYKKIIQAEAELSNALATSGGALGISKAEAVAAAEGMASLGVGTLKAVDAITEIAKAGNIGKESLELITKAAVDLEKTAGVSIEETAKQYAKLQEDPAKALTDIAQKTGLVDKATLDFVYSLEQQGDKTEAARIATLALASAHAQVASETRDNWSPIETLWNDIKSAISRVKQEIYALTTSNAVVGALRTVWEAVAVTVSEVWFTIKGVGKEIGGIGAQIAAVLRGDFSGAAEIGKQMKLDAAAAAEEQKKYVAAILDRSNQEKKFFNENKVQNSQYAKWRKENDKALDEGISKADKYKAKQLEMQKAVLAGTVSQIEADKALAGWKKIILGEEKTKKDPSENYYAALMREATNNTIAANTATQELTKSEQKLLEVKADPRFAKLTATQQADVIAKYDAAIAAERQTAMTEKLAEAEEHRLKLLGKSEGIGKQYYADMQKLEEFAKVAGWSREEIEELTRAVFKSTPAWKAYEKALEDVNTASRKFNEDIIASQEKTAGENRELDHRLDLLGRTTEEQKILSIEYQRANKIREVDVRLAKQLRDIEAEIAKAKKKGLAQSDYQDLLDSQVQMQQAAAEEIRAINRETAVIYAEDLDKEIRAIKSGITDSIVTALFEGGKAGSSKLRNVVVEALKKPVTIVVNAVVNTLLGGVMNSFTTSMMSGGGGLLGGISGLSGLVSTSNNLYSAITGGFANLSGSIATQVQSGLNFLTGSGGMISQGPIQVGGLSQGIGSVAAPLLGAYGGISAGRLIGDGYSLNGGSGNSTINLGTAIGSLFGPLGGLAGGAIGGGINRLFGRKLKESGIEGTFGGETGFEGRSYQYYKGGLFRSNKTKYGELDEETRSNFAKSFFDMKSGVAEMAKILGVGTESLEDFTYKFKVNLKGLSEEEATKAIQEQFKLMGEEMAKLVLSTDKYSLAEETRMDTLVRLSATLSTVNTIFENMGMTMYELGLSGADAAYELTQLFGGLDKFTSVLSNYYEKFYSDSERQILLQSQLDRAFKDLGVVAPKTREEFRALVEVQDLTTEGGRKTFTELMKLVDGFDVLASQAEQLAEEIASAAEEARKNAIEAAYSALETAVNAQKEILKVQESAQTAVVNNLKSIFDLLKKNVRDLYMQVGSTAGMLASQGRGVISNAISTGTLPDNETLTEAISAVRSEIDSSSYATQFEQDKARLQFAAELQILQDQAGSQLSVAELTLKAIKDQTIYLDGLLKSAREQIDAALGITNVLLSVEAALQAITDILKPPVDETNLKAPGSAGGFVIGGGGGTGAATAYDRDADLKAQIDRQLQFAETDGRGFDDPRTLAAVNAALYGSGASNADIARLYKVPEEDIDRLFSNVGIARYADGGVFTNGVVTKPTMFNASQMGEAGAEAIMPLTNIGGRLGVSATVSDNSALADKVERLESALQVIAVNTSKVARILDAAQGTDGRSLITTPAA